jgi:hypothetical protein
VKMKLGVPFQPGSELGMFVRCIVVDNQVQFPFGRGLAVDLIEEADKFLMPVARNALADDPALQHVKRGEQSRCAVTLVIMGHRPTAALLHRQPRLGAVECLDLRFFID